AAVLGRNGAAGIRGVDVDGRDIARIVDGYGATHRAGDLQTTTEPGVGQQKLLALGEFDRRDVAATCDLGNAIEIRRNLAPRPVMGNRLELGGPDPAGGDLPAGVVSRFAKPRAL